MAVPAVEAVIASLKYVPEIVDVVEKTWKKIRPPPQLATPGAKNGVVNTTFYSGDHNFQISIPDEKNWTFWKPTPQYIASLGSDFALPDIDVPIVILFKGMIRFYRPIVYITVTDVGQTAIEDLVEAEKIALQNDSYLLDDKGVKISSDSMSAAILGTGRPYFKQTTSCALEQIFVNRCKGYYIRAYYASDSDDLVRPPQGLREIFSSFKLIK